MKKVTKFEANDGSLHDTKESAEKRNSLNDLKSWYEENKLYGKSIGCKIEWEDLIEWLFENEEEVQEILKAGSWED